ncbi:winged helix-turn-helix domain-containing protein [Sphingomonas sediminicola]|uniref:winged helix-turn-helix domain-containing protein n=1 Tax=Sphingomonas sediminicola TaxID=386874 RepID=UPI003CF9707B
MYELTEDWVHGIDLAQEAGFDLGPLRVWPARCEVEWNGDFQTLQRRVMQVLVVLAKARGSVVSQNDLVIRCWRGLAVSDDAIYRCISQLRKLAAGYPEAPYAIEAIPGVGYRLTSSSLGKDDPAVAPTRRQRRFAFWPWVAATVVATLIILAGAFWIVRGRVSDDHLPDRVAVQLFDTLSNSEDARSLARRIPNEVVNELGDSQIETVLAGNGAPGSASPLPGLVVTGLVRDDASNLIVDVRIEDGRSHAALWSLEFKRNRGEASGLPMEVAARVADVVNIAIFARNANPPLTDNSALSALLQTNDMIRESQSDWAQMIERAQGVVARHPEFAFGHDVLAVAYATASERIDIPDRAEAMKEAARHEAKLTLKLDPADAGAYVVLSWMEPSYRGREAWLLRGMKYGRHPKGPVGALYSYESWLLSDVGRLREALSSQLVAHANDEWGAPKTAQLARAYANIGNLPAARAWIQKGVQLWPNHSGIRRYQRHIAGFYEQPSEALATFNSMDAQAPSGKDENQIWRSFVKAKAAHSEQLTAETTLQIREAADQEKISRENEILMLAALGETRQALEAANSTLNKRRFESWVLFAPVTRNLRQNPGFVDLAARMGLIEYWRETGKRPDFCTSPPTRSECTPQLLAAIKSN